jgi:hypothetical protein
MPLTKVSLSEDFFGACYDRLTPSSDKAPAWYCPGCSREKSLQVDYRTIAAAWGALEAEEPSPLADADIRTRSCARLREIAEMLTSAQQPSRLLNVAQVDALCQALAAA